MTPEPNFHCPLWPLCGCPDGAVRTDCPGLQQPGSAPPRRYDPAGPDDIPPDSLWQPDAQQLRRA